MFKKTFCTCLVIMLTICFIMPVSAFASDDHVGYSVQAQLPDNQLDKKHTYFDLHMKPGQKQELNVIIYNNETEAITVKTAVHNASTNRNGLVVYEAGDEIDPSLVTPLTDILMLETDEVVVPAGKSKTVTAHLEMPEQSYDGIILGGFHFEKVMNEEESTTGVSLQNKYAYVIGVQLTETDHDVLPELHLQSVTPDLVNHRTAVIANIQNKEAVLVGDLVINAAVYKSGETEAVKEKSQENIRMAPNSNMAYTIDWANKTLDPGTYILKMTATNQSDTWEWESSFEIDKADAKILNKQAVALDNEQGNLFLITSISILSLIIIGLLFYIWLLKHRRDYSEDTNDFS